MENSTVHFIDFIKKINNSTNIILTKINYANIINDLFPEIPSKITRKRRILSQFSKEEENELKFLTDIFVQINLDAAN